jgi:MvdD pre-ATP grasp domain
MIGIVSHAGDLHTKEVCQHLDALDVDHLLLDTALIPAEAAITTAQDPLAGWTGSWTSDGGRWDLADLRAVWWRRPQPFSLHDEVTQTQDRMFARGECAAMAAGLWSCLDAEWVNDPDRDEAASRKMWQLRLASRLGLRVPRTCMTNDPLRAREFVAAESGAAIFKSFSATPATWRETRPVRPGDLELMDCVRFAPVIFQELIPGGISTPRAGSGILLFTKPDSSHLNYARR